MSCPLWLLLLFLQPFVQLFLQPFVQLFLQPFVQSSAAARAVDDAAQRWLRRFAHAEPCSRSEGICTGTIGALPHFEVRVGRVGKRLVRVSLPFAPGALPQQMGL